MTHHYFSWIEEGRWQGNCLLSKEQIGSLLTQFKWRYPVFASIQKYDSDGKVISCPLYVDIDGDSKEGISALKMAQEIVLEIESRYAVTPDIFFSGNKGYHIILPVEIKHPLCHYVALTMIQGLGCSGYSNIDRNVYTGRRMWRIAKSPASKSGFYKTRLTRQELFDFGMDEHRQFSQTNSSENKSEFDLSKLNQNRWNEDLLNAVAHFDKKTLEYETKSATDRQARPWTSCLDSILSTPAESGERSTTAFILARWYMQAGVDESEALKSFLRYQHWIDFETEGKGISNMLRSLYKQGRIPTLGCKYPGGDRDILKRHCDEFCPYNEVQWSLFG